MPAVGLDEPHDEAPDRGLAAAGFADERQGLARPSANETPSTAFTVASGRPKAERFDDEVLDEVLDLEHRRVMPRASRAARASSATGARRSTVGERRQLGALRDAERAAGLEAAALPAARVMFGTVPSMAASRGRRRSRRGSAPRSPTV